MPKLLALDAATENCSVAVINEEEVYSQTSDVPKSHAKVLLPMIDAVLCESSLSLSDLDAIVVTNGPGSFTGIRIGIGLVQGLAYGANKPVLTVSTMEVLAHQLVREWELHNSGDRLEEGSLIVPALDARMKEVYWAVFCYRDGRLEEMLPPQVSSADILNNEVATKAANAKAIGGGHGWSVPDAKSETLTYCNASLLPEASCVADITAKKLVSKVINLEECNRDALIEPLYLRNEVSWEKRKRIRQPNA